MIEDGARDDMASRLSEQRIDGIWAVAFKVLLAMFPIFFPPVLALMIWLTNEQFKDINFRTSGERFTQGDGRALEDKISTRLGPKIDGVDSRVQRLEQDAARIYSKLEQIDDRLKQ